MKIAVVGPGALGTLFAAYLTEGGLDVLLVDHRPERARRLDDAGIRVQGLRGERHVPVRVTAESGAAGPVDLLILCVKAFQTEGALRAHAALASGSTVAWTVQNGLGNTDAMARVLPASQVVGGSTTMGANLLEPGVVHHAGEGDTWVGELEGGSSERVERIASALSAAGIAVQVAAEIRKVIWTKLLVNVGINALTAILRVRNGRLVEIEPARRLMEAAVREAVALAAGQGLDFDADAVQARVEQVAKLTAQNRSSMLADMLAGRPTEIDYINGAIARLGEAPVNRSLCELVQAAGASAGFREG
ncbi:MAG: 2-dehydropantoate 2-reductase [Deltaproteobacteria bacterium]|nr:2-dehydropantoate 2-reductase [Deltaproteobacteria bacterium]